jgi:hypothetical protein
LVLPSLLLPFYYLLRPVYIHIDNPDFIWGLIILAVITFGALEIYNRNYLAKTIKQFKPFSFINRLQPSELIYLKTQKLSDVIHGTLNELVNNNSIVINSDYTIELASNFKVHNIEQHQVLDALHDSGPIAYPGLLWQLLTKPVFGNVANAMRALEKYYIKSTSFGRLFYTNFIILSLLLMTGTIRLYTGLLRDKPITYIAVVILVLTVLIVHYLQRLTTLFCTTALPDYYRKEVLPNTNTEDNLQWQYFLSGHCCSFRFFPSTGKSHQSGQIFIK